MAAATAVRSILRSTTVRSASMRFASKNCSARSPRLLPKLGPAVPRFLRSSMVTCFCLESLHPMHSATASALMTSLLSVSIQGNCCILKGIRNPLRLKPLGFT
ncbi:hypothetical protein MA16_Dca020503 [Dendrobium catenatum]|uniref:Protein NUCLEAR FUSION DEFECTIVE 6, chloroplastic/mitochondrial n=1 Tax=Dendrobium catenatum TaxID=906689 RepID=A0A2I0V9M0_9ASPA|nr:hypothetical protein MA16_Dca020503 [Dendrobium catenatum]